MLNASETMDDVESTVTNLLNQNNPYQQSKHLLFYPEISVVYTPHQGNIFDNL